MSSSLGMKLSLPPEMAAKLRQSSQSDKASDDSSDTQPQKQQPQQQQQDDAKLPKITIDVENLVGYKPEMEEMESIKSQLLEAMWTRYHLEERHDVPKDSVAPTSAPPDFDFQVVDLLQSGVARFGESTQEESTTNEASLVLAYPPTIITSDGESKLTAMLWRQTSNCPPAFQDRQETAFIPHLWHYLAYCSRNLDWKYQMSQELANLVEQEEARIRYQEWTTTQRKAKLDQLYSIRETIVHQVEMNKRKYDSFVHERETIVKEKMQQHQRLENAATSALSFPEEFALLGMQDRTTEEPEDDWGLGDDNDSYGMSGGSDYSDYSDGSDGGYNTDDSLSEREEEEGVDGPIPVSQQQLLPAGEGAASVDPQHLSIGGEEKGLPQAPSDGVGGQEANTDNQTESNALSVPFQRRQERRRQAKERKRRERKEAKRQAEKERLKKLEQELKEQHTSREMVVAQTIYEALAKKLENVEELLESLQDEEWQAEEDRENEAESKEATAYQREESFSLLDQILAMILGTTPIPQGKTSEEHYRFVQEEHKFIVNEWKNYFGRLPASLGGASEPNKPWPAPDATETASPSELRMQLGIVDNPDGDWDVDDDDMEEKLTATKESTKPKIYGLRPGGSLK